MNDIANIDPVVGRRFVSSSNNVCTVSKMGEGAIRCGWSLPPSEKDIQEFYDWMVSILGPLDPENFMAGKKSEGAYAKGDAAYREWLRRNK